MHKKPDLNIFRSLLFVFDIDNPDNDSKTRQDILVSKNINNTQELKELFDTILKSELLAYTPEARKRCIKTLEHSLITNESFEVLFEKITTHFDDNIEDRRQFMQALYNCLTHYNAET